VAGLGAALGLGRAGWPVVVLDRDQLAPADRPDAAFSLPRRGAPQVHHTHGLLARLTATTRDRFPDVLDSLVAAGGVEVDLSDRFEDRRPGDADLRVLLARRTTLDWALRRAAAAEPSLTLRGGEVVDSLLAGGGARVDGGTGAGGDHPAAPIVAGVRLASGEVLPAAAVVVAAGARAPLPRWLAALGVEVGEDEHQTGIVYLTRWYRTGAGWDAVIDGEELVRLAGDLGYLFYLAVPADQHAFSLTMAIGATDEALRSQLLDPAAFDRAARALPLPSGLVDRLVPDGPVHRMGGLVNRLRRFTSADGRPLVLGVHAVGDTHTCTNPIYGRGCSLALVQAVALTDAMMTHPTDSVARSLAYEDACRAQTQPWYHISVETDRARQARYQRDGQPGATSSPSVMDQLLRLGSDDPIVGRAILRAVNLLATPQQLMNEPEVMTRVMELAAAGGGAAYARNRWAREGPTREEMIELTAA
jgi:2-polyprenyl-6-methoxyphenol hydroxylase-like FAD-dependent oxidoreductase